MTQDTRSPARMQRPVFWHALCTFSCRSAHGAVGIQEKWCTGGAGEATVADAMRIENVAAPVRSH